jgi:hypothetical protein
VPAQWIALAVATLAAAMGLGLLLGLDGCSHPSASIRLGRRRPLLASPRLRTVGRPCVASVALDAEMSVSGL